MVKFARLGVWFVMVGLLCVVGYGCASTRPSPTESACAAEARVGPRVEPARPLGRLDGLYAGPMVVRGLPAGGVSFLMERGRIHSSEVEIDDRIYCAAQEALHGGDVTIRVESDKKAINLTGQYTDEMFRGHFTLVVDGVTRRGDWTAKRVRRWERTDWRSSGASGQ